MAAAVALGFLGCDMALRSRLLAEFVVPEGAGFDFSKWSDLQMLVMVGGRERTETEYRSLLLASGFDLCEVVATATPLKLLVARPLLQ